MDGFDQALDTPDDLRTVYRPAVGGSVAKQIAHLDDNCRAFIAHSPFVVVSTADDTGRCDTSPRGGPPGFVTVLDDHRLAIPDLSGNNRLDTMENLVRSNGIGLLFLIPGMDETLRVNGRATVTTDPAVLDACPVGDVRPKVVVGVTVEEAYIHCAKALRRAGLWDPAAWPDTTHLPSAACMLRDHLKLPDVEPEAIERDLEVAYEHTMWVAGGDEPWRTDGG